MSRIPSYPKVHALGHYQIDGILDGFDVVQEKYDGSQISWAVIDGQLVIKSRRRELNLDNPDKLFAPAVKTIRDIHDEGLLIPGYIYRGEAICSKKHNTLEYSVTPRSYIVLFDVERKDGQAYRPLHPTIVRDIAMCFYIGHAAELSIDRSKPLMDQVDRILDTESSLGGPKIEGFVVKNYGKYTADDKFMVGKFVSESFKEKHQSDWKGKNPGRVELIEWIGNSLCTEARWNKALQYLRDEGKLLGEPKDIGNLVARVQEDISEEESDWIKRKLFDHFWRQIRARATRGLPEWYKRLLLEKAS